MKAFSSYHPAVLFFYFIAVLATAMFTSHPVLLAEAFLGGIFFAATLAKRNAFWSDLGFYLFLILAVAATNPLFSHNGATPMFFLNGNAVTKEALLAGLSIAVMLIGVLCWFQCYSKVMSSDKFLYLFAHSIPKLSLVLTMILRFIPLFRLQARRVRNAQRTMGRYSSDGFMDKIRASLGVFSIMITWALENAVETGDSMKARGYGLKGKSHYSLFRFSKKDAGLLAGIAVLFSVVLAGALRGDLDFSYYPRITPLAAGWIPAMCFASFGILAFLPFLIEIKERIQWKYFVSKI